MRPKTFAAWLINPYMISQGTMVLCKKDTMLPMSPAKKDIKTRTWNIIICQRVGWHVEMQLKPWPLPLTNEANPVTVCKCSFRSLQWRRWTCHNKSKKINTCFECLAPEWPEIWRKKDGTHSSNPTASGFHLDPFGVLVAPFHPRRAAPEVVHSCGVGPRWSPSVRGWSGSPGQRSKQNMSGLWHLMCLEFGDLLVTVLSILPTSQNFMYILYYRDYIMKNYMGFWPVARAKHHSDAK